jgi:hypothetical protein
MNCAIIDCNLLRFFFFFDINIIGTFIGILFIVFLLKLCYFQYEKKKTCKIFYTNILNKDSHVLFCSTSNPLIMLMFSLSTILKKICIHCFCVWVPMVSKMQTILNSIKNLLGSLFCAPLN